MARQQQMKKKFVINAPGGSTNTKVTVEFVADWSFSRGEAEARARDILDEIMVALGKRYRPSRMTVRK